MSYRSSRKTKKNSSAYLNSSKINSGTTPDGIKWKKTGSTVRKKCIKCINLLHYKHSHFLLFYIFF